MTRVIAGRAGGRRLVVPSGLGTRPTGERTREALFSALGDLDGDQVLDLYAGSGALGLEALSRGAVRAVLVERDSAALRCLRTNVSALQLPGATVLAREVVELLGEGPHAAGGPVTLVFLDPPYAQSADPALAALATGGWLLPRARVVVERAQASVAPTWPAGLSLERSRRYAQTRLWYGRAS